MAKSAKIADLAAKAGQVAQPKGQDTQGWDSVDTTSDAPVDAESIPATLTALASAKDKVTYSGLTLDLTKMTPTGIAYLLQYGYSQSLQDSAAGAKKLATEAHKGRSTDATAFEKLCAEMDKSTDEMAAISAEEFANAYAQYCRAERSQAIFTDSLGQRVGGGGGGPVDPIAKLQRDIAKERISAASKARGTKMPTGDALNSLVVQLLAGKHFDSIHAEAVRRHSALDIDLSDIL